MSIEDEELNEMNGFNKDLNGAQFPPINGMDVNGNEGSDNSSATKFFAKSLVDIVNSSRLDNKLINVPTGVSENEDDVVIFDDEIIELGSKKWNLAMCRKFIGCSMGFMRLDITLGECGVD
uniref:ATPase, F1/V1/A1 complex, alpha/beta subunit, zinc knuckle CX2CX4HX4C n=1 Tax=Tanacetum cinerariifolium TaxID=118510 RepID=A0A699HLN8_TANCI|nr:ATPase, F1/V1/A1 complex, alpha/beta subunit, zinc knuckle CX2CX4HX4C [Tanacetum cinerariifolium]